MTLQGIVLLNLFGLALVVWVLNLVRRDRLHVAYGAMFLILIVTAMAVVSMPALLNRITRLVGAVFPVSALTLIALCFLVVMLVYVLGQLTVLSNRLATTVQELAIDRATQGRSGVDAPPRENPVKDPSGQSSPSSDKDERSPLEPSKLSMTGPREAPTGHPD